MAEFSNVIAENQNDIVHILENASHFNDADSGYRHVRVRDIQQNTDVSACYMKGTCMFKFRQSYWLEWSRISNTVKDDCVTRTI